MSDFQEMNKLASASSSLTRIVPYTPENLKMCADLIRNGKLVGMPTETVYGLAANALDAEACRSIFTTKGRPLTDPLIVHVHSKEQALSLADPFQSPNLFKIFCTLADKFWPGPLTMIVAANLDKIPMMITANTGSVGLRMPNHPVALDLLREADRPIAAPSANKFGHVSPTKPDHVYNDFYKDSEVTILDGGQCNFGIESTVLKIIELEPTKFELFILRKGGVSEKALIETFTDIGKDDELGDLTIEVTKKAHSHFKNEDENLEGPGQFLRHYAPNIDSFLFNGVLKERSKVEVEKCVVIDFGGLLSEFQPKCV